MHSSESVLLVMLTVVMMIILLVVSDRLPIWPQRRERHCHIRCDEDGITALGR